MQNYGFFFSKNLRYLKSKISPKLYRLLIFLFLTSFLSISQIQSGQKIMKFFVMFYWNY